MTANEWIAVALIAVYAIVVGAAIMRALYMRTRRAWMEAGALVALPLGVAWAVWQMMRPDHSEPTQITEDDILTPPPGPAPPPMPKDHDQKWRHYVNSLDPVDPPPPHRDRRDDGVSDSIARRLDAILADAKRRRERLAKDDDDGDT